MNEDDIIEIVLLRNVRFRNEHNGKVFNPEDAIVVKYRNGKEHYLSMYSKRDLIEYFTIIENARTTRKTIFKEEIIEGE